MHDGHGARSGEPLGTGRHVCMVVDDDEGSSRVVAGFLAAGDALGEKTFVFGPRDSPLAARLRRLARVTADPHHAVLGGGPFDAPAMLAMFREQAALARREGYTGLRVAADMDWLLPASPAAADIVAFEANLDRLFAAIGATVLCAYRRRSFDPATLTGTLCVHPAHIARELEPPFKLVAGDADRWLLSGSVDIASAPHLAAALRATADTPWVLDVAGLEFVDVAGMRTIAESAVTAGVSLEMRNACPAVRRHWELAGFGEAAPGVRVTG